MNKSYLKSFFTTCTGLLALSLLVMGLSSYTYYSTLGIDNERVQGEQVDYHYYRFWWPGNGALLIGFGASLKAYDPATQYDLFDPAGTLFRTPYKPLEIKSWWNRLGFWWINHKNPRQVWIGIPALLPALFLMVAWWRLRKFRFKV